MRYVKVSYNCSSLRLRQHQTWSVTLSMKNGLRSQLHVRAWIHRSCSSWQFRTFHFPLWITVSHNSELYRLRQCLLGPLWSNSTSLLLSYLFLVSFAKMTSLILCSSSNLFSSKLQMLKTSTYWAHLRDLNCPCSDFAASINVPDFRCSLRTHLFPRHSLHPCHIQHSHSC